MSPTEQHEPMHESPEEGSNRVAAEPHNAGSGAIDQTSGNIDKIRDILFGANMRDYEARFARLEEALMKEAAELRESTRRRFEALENYVKKEVDALQSRLKTERDERSDALSQQSRELTEASEALSKKIRDLDDHGAGVASELRQDILNHSGNLMDELRARHEEISGLLERRFQELHHNKTDRAALATLLNEMAMRLTAEFRIPGAER
jgi:DNA repair exonuclease SbcCD ATPase subunit